MAEPTTSEAQQQHRQLTALGAQLAVAVQDSHLPAVHHPRTTGGSAGGADRLGYRGASLHQPQDLGVVFIANGSGRLLMGLSDFTRARRGVCFIFSATAMTLCHLGNFIFVNEKHRVFYGVIMAGLGYGSMWGSTPIITAEAFGRRAFAVTFGWISLSYSIAAVVFNLIVGHLYDAQLESGTTICLGDKCYRDAYILCACTSVVGLVIAVIMYSRTKRGLKGGRVAAALATAETGK